MRKWIDITFRKNRSYPSHEAFMQRFYGTSYAHYAQMSASFEIAVWSNAGFCGDAVGHGVTWHYRNLDDPREIRKLVAAQASVYFLHGFVSPVHVMFLRWQLPRGSVVIVRHHAELPFSNSFKRWLQRMAFRSCDGFAFVSVQQAQPFIEAGVIRPAAEIAEIMECSTLFQGGSKINDNGDRLPLLWVGRLNANKDPITVLRALSVLKKHGRPFHLEMIFTDDALLSACKEFVAVHGMGADIAFRGAVSHGALQDIYLRSSYFISASHSEGSGVALCEAMACGCVPLVTNIPSFYRMTGNGQVGRLYPPGDHAALFEILKEIEAVPADSDRVRVTGQFQSSLSFQAIAQKYIQLAGRLLSRAV
jgi:glycosyltransferase involved in cell wall biosynthesis